MTLGSSLLLLVLIGHSGTYASDILSANITSSKLEGPACSNDVITFTCTIHGIFLTWALDENITVTYNNDATCRNFTQIVHKKFRGDVVLVSIVRDDDRLSTFKSVMTLSSSAAATVKIDCLTPNSTMSPSVTINATRYLLRVLGPSNPATVQNFTATQIAYSEELEVNLFNLSWAVVPANATQSIELYRVTIIDDGNIVDNSTVLHPDTTSALISVLDEVQKLKFRLETSYKCYNLSLLTISSTPAASSFSLLMMILSSISVAAIMTF